jgi:hypothetical protein
VEAGSQLPVFRKRPVILHNPKKCGNVIAIFPVLPILQPEKNFTVAAFSHKNTHIGLAALLENIFINIRGLLHTGDNSFADRDAEKRRIRVIELSMELKTKREFA